MVKMKRTTFVNQFLFPPHHNMSFSWLQARKEGCGQCGRECQAADLRRVFLWLPTLWKPRLPFSQSLPQLLEPTREMSNRAPMLLLWFSRWFRRGIWLKPDAQPSNANPTTNPKLLIAINRISSSPPVVLLTKLTLCVILNLLVSSCSFLLLNRRIAKFITERRCDRVELDLHANRAIRMSIQSIAMHYMCFLFLSTDALNSLKMFSHSGWR